MAPMRQEAANHRPRPHERAALGADERGWLIRDHKDVDSLTRRAKEKEKKKKEKNQARGGGGTQIQLWALALKRHLV